MKAKNVLELKIETPEHVYAPREDSFLLARALENERNVGSALDLGTGSGFIGLTLVLLKAKKLSVVDVAGESLKTAQENFRRNGVRQKISFVQ